MIIFLNHWAVLPQTYAKMGIVMIGLDDGLWPVRFYAISWVYDDLSKMEWQEPKFSEYLILIKKFQDIWKWRLQMTATVFRPHFYKIE